jgi:hypothetical protein
MTTRRLAAILAADSRLMSTNEEGTLARLQVLRSVVVDPAVAKGGPMSTAPAVLAEFPRAVEALRFAVEKQGQSLRGHPGGRAAIAAEALTLRYGNRQIEGDEKQ